MPLMHYNKEIFFRVFLLLFLVNTIILAECTSETNDIKVGECYEQEGNFNLAQAAYERAIIEDVNSSLAHRKLSDLYTKMQMPKQASAALSGSDNRQLTPQQKTTLQAMQEEQEKQLSEFHTRLTLKGGYDSNINISPLDDTLINRAEALDTFFARATVDLSYLHDLSEYGGWYLRSDTNVYFQDNASTHDYDVLYGRVYAGGGYRNSLFNLYLPLFYDRLNYLNKDLLQESGVRPDLTLSLSLHWYLDLNAMYTARRYIESVDRIRDDNIYAAGVGFYWLEDANLFYLKLRYESYQAENSLAPNFTDKSLYYFNLGGNYDLGNLTDFIGEYQFRQGEFDDHQNINRQDSNHNISLAIEQTLAYGFRLRGDYRYLYNSSTLSEAQYQKNEIMLGLVYNY